MVSWLELLPSELRQAGHLYERTGEVAWARAEAIEVLHQIRSMGFAVVGLEVWDMTDGIPSLPYLYTVDFSPRQGESRDEFARRSVESAEQIVREFEWPSVDNATTLGAPMFCLTLDRD